MTTFHGIRCQRASCRLAVAATAVLFYSLFAARLAAVPLQFHVSPSGSDSTGTGTEISPWQTIVKARDHIRTQGLNVGMTDDIFVNVAAGRYEISSPITFGATDSGSNGYAIVYRNGGGIGTALFDAATTVTGWTVHSGSIWKASVSNIAFKTLYENDRRAHRARTPNLGSEPRYPIYFGPYLLSAGGGSTYLTWQTGDLNPSTWVLDGSARVRWWGDAGGPDWNLWSYNLSSIDVTNRRLYFTSGLKNPGTNDRYYVDGIYQLLDAAGEYHLDAPNNLLYFIPRDGNPNNSAVLIPQSPSIIQAAGSAVGQSNHVHDLKFVGLAFAHTDYVQVDDTANTAPRAVVELQHAHNIEIIDCHFYSYGHSAVRLFDDCDNNMIYGCRIERAGIGGIEMINTLQRAAYPNDKNEYNVVSNCLIHDLGEERVWGFLATGVYLHSTENCEVSYCEIYNSGRYATSLRGNYSTQWTVPDNGRHPAENNVFSHIRAYDCATDSGDMGVIHAAHCGSTLSPNIHTNYWNQIFVAGAYAHPSMADPREPNAIFLDHPHSCESQNFANVKLTFAQGDEYRTNVNPSQTFSNVNWTGTFNDANMDYAGSGLKSDFPAAYRSVTDEILVDDHTIDYSEFQPSTWTDSTIAGVFKGDSRYNSGNSTAQYAEWRPNLPVAGEYQVWIWKHSYHASASPNAPYLVVDSTGSSNYSVNQQSPSDQWELLGIHNFAAGRSGYVRLNANGGAGYAVRADAVLFVPVPEAWWEADNAAIDSSGNGHTATLQNGATYTTGAMVGTHALSLDGNNDYASVADDPALDLGTSDFAIAGWFYRTPDTATNLRIVSKGAGASSDIGYAIWASDTEVRVSVSNGTTNRAVSKAHAGTNTWNHVAVNIDRDGNLLLYVNGSSSPASVSIADWSATDISNARNLNIGRNVTSGSQFWPGRIDDVRLYRRLLTAAEIDGLAAP